MRLLDRAAGSDETPGKKTEPGDTLLRGLRALSVLAAVFVAVVTLLPSRTELKVPLLVEAREIGDELNAAMVFGVIAMLVVVLVLAAWKSRLARRLKMSWPLFLCGIAYLVGFIILISMALRDAVYGRLLGSAPGGLDSSSAGLDAEHALTYAAFTIIVAIAWRQKMSVLWQAPVLFAYGYALETAQKLVPGRDFGWGDIAANGLGIAIGIVGVQLFDLLADYRKGRTVPAVRPHHRNGRQRSHRSSKRPSRSKNAAIITVLAGAAVAAASILFGALAEIRFAQVGWQIFTQFSAPYAFTFWLGVLITGLGIYQFRARSADPGSGVRIRSPRSDLEPRRPR